MSVKKIAYVEIWGNDPVSAMPCKEGVLWLMDDGTIVADPPTVPLQRMIDHPVGRHQEITAKDNPLEFMKELCMFYHGSYTRASEMRWGTPMATE
jgi:hypothetical protein